MEDLFWIGFVGAAIALLFAWLQRSRVMSFSEGNVHKEFLYYHRL